MEINYEDINKNNIIIDIRYPSDYEEYHLKNSINIPRIVLLSDPKKYLSDKENYIICDKGIVSKSCVKVLNALGYKCKSIEGGIERVRKKI